MLIVWLVLWSASVCCLADERYDEDGRLIDVGIPARVAANFPDITFGTVVIFGDELFTSPTLNLRYRVVPLPKTGWARLIIPDYLSVGFGADHVLSSIQWELIPEILTVGGGVAYNTVDNELLGQCNFEFLKF